VGAGDYDTWKQNFGATLSDQQDSVSPAIAAVALDLSQDAHADQSADTDATVAPQSFTSIDPDVRNGGLNLERPIVRSAATANRDNTLLLLALHRAQGDNAITQDREIDRTAHDAVFAEPDSPPEANELAPDFVRLR
jgi:hypothetical protein